MGVDVQLYALVKVTPEELAVANAYFSKYVPKVMINEYSRREGPLFYEGPEHDFRDIINPDTPQWPRVELDTLQRYAATYKTWPWPPIYQAIRLLQAIFPEAVVCYGGDGLH